ncbi:hypothetical protein [Methylobacterium iners]|jgi:hypothetical protein|uniref:Serine/threonine protein kinase n=1 Tax=Methylobacterium iners TaxID=418707 RepID=A0ABQ4RS85_9HYPH|nr:hypothetical protein [Methylobacterium iners]GJD93052.1 hypothetical protein OCOJLMKI_0238 [Methylobacterium iners]
MPKLPHVAAAFLLAMAGTAFAQSPDAPLRGRDTAPNMPAPDKTIPEKVQPSEGAPAGGGTLSDKLERNDGVIKPPGNAAPGMVVTPPDPNPSSMPVIKPGELPGRQPGTEAR